MGRHSIAHHLLRYRPSEILDVCRHIRLRFPRDSGLASNALLRADKSGPSKCGVFYFVLPPRQSSSRHWRDEVPSSIPLDQARDGESRRWRDRTRASYLAHSERPIRVAHPSAVFSTSYSLLGNPHVRQPACGWSSKFRVPGSRYFPVSPFHRYSGSLRSNEFPLLSPAIRPASGCAAAN